MLARGSPRRKQLRPARQPATGPHAASEHSADRRRGSAKMPAMSAAHAFTLNLRAAANGVVPARANTIKTTTIKG